MAYDVFPSALRAGWGLWLALGVFAATAALWWARQGRRAVEAEIAGRSRSGLTNLFFRRWFHWLLSPLEGALLRARVSPDWLNWTGLAFNVLAGILLATGWAASAAGAMIAGGACNVLNGRLAHALGRASERSAFLDSSLDRYAELAQYLGLLWLLGADRQLALLVLLAASGALLVSYARARAEALGAVKVAVFAERPERLILLVLACLSTPLELGIEDALGWPERYYVLTGMVFFLAGATHLGAAQHDASVARALRAAAPAEAEGESEEEEAPGGS